MRGKSINRCVFLVSKLSGYLIACLSELERRTGCEILICHWTAVDEAPYDQALFDSVGTRFEKRNIDRASLLKRVVDFDPDLVFISGWMDKDYLHVAKIMRAGGAPVVAGCDTQWRGDLRQHVACWLSPLKLRPAIDAFWVSGERQREFVKRLGYSATSCLEGFYTCDTKAFSVKEREANRKDAFIYVGRLMERKGTDILLDAYAAYRARTSDPWSLRIVGAGPMKDRVQSMEGVEDMGFVQPPDLPKIYAAASCFVMPSRYEPWGVAIHEAACSGLPIICTTACGAGVHLVRDGFNGYKVDAGDSQGLSQRMAHFAGMSAEDRFLFGSRSEILAKQYAPDLWVESLACWFRVAP